MANLLNVMSVYHMHYDVIELDLLKTMIALVSTIRRNVTRHLQEKETIASPTRVITHAWHKLPRKKRQSTC